MKTSATKIIQENIAKQIVADTTVEWDIINISFEHYKHERIGYSEIYVANYLKDNEKKSFDLSLEALDLLIELQVRMNLDGDSWTWLLFELTSNGNFKFNFKYDLPPNTRIKLAANGLLN
jgi:hypothetical protein